MSLSSDKTLAVIVCMHTHVRKQASKLHSPCLSFISRTLSFCEMCLPYSQEKGTCGNDWTSKYVSELTHFEDAAMPLMLFPTRTAWKCSWSQNLKRLILRNVSAHFPLICCCVSGCFSCISGPRVDWTTGVYRGSEIGTSRRVLKVSLAALLCKCVSFLPWQYGWVLRTCCAWCGVVLWCILHASCMMTCDANAPWIPLITINKQNLCRSPLASWSCCVVAVLTLYQHQANTCCDAWCVAHDNVASCFALPVAYSTYWLPDTTCP